MTIMIFLLICSSICLTSLSFSPDSTIRLTVPGKEISFVSGNVFGANIIFRKDEKNILKTRLISMGKDVKQIFRMVYRKDEYVLCESEHILTIFSTEGTGLCIYDLKDKVVKSCCIADLNNSGEENILLITGKKDQAYGEDMLILSFHINTSGGYEICEYYHHPFEGMNPWKIQTADVDGDGKREISIGMYKKTPFHLVMAKRPFVYSWSGNGISPKWLGSRLSRPFDDYIFADINHDGKDEIVSIETLSGGQKVLNSYMWRGFGFEAMVESAKFEDVSEIRKGSALGQGEELLARIKEKEKWEWCVLSYTNECLAVKDRLSENNSLSRMLKK